MENNKSKNIRTFDLGTYLETAGVKRKVVAYRKKQIIFSQGDKCN